MLARHERIIERDLAVGAPPNERIPLREIYLLEEKTEAEPGQGRLPSGAGKTELQT